MTSWVTAWPVRPVLHGPANSQLRRGQLESTGHSAPTGQALVFIRAPRPHPCGCPSGVALRQRGRDLVPGPWSHAVLHGARPGPTQHLLHCRCVSGLWTLGATAERWQAALPCIWSLNPAASWVTQQPVGSDILRPGTHGGGLDSGLWCGDLLPSALPEACAQQLVPMGSTTPPPCSPSAADPPATIRGHCCFSQQ